MPIIPDHAPFSESQRQFLAELFAPHVGVRTETSATHGDGAQASDLDSAPWHDQDMPLSERMALAEDSPFEHRLMAAMAQQDCGQCGYDCKGYAGALARGEESDLSLCVPGANRTRKQLRALNAEYGEVIVATPKSEAAAQPGYHRKNPYFTLVSRVTSLHTPESTKDTRAVVVDLKGSGITYTPGDSIGIYPENDPELVEHVLETLGADGAAQVALADGRELDLRQALREHYDVTCPSDEVLELLAREATDKEEAAILQALAKEGLQAGHDLVDVLTDFPSARPRIEPLAQALGRLQPRLYSIASSLGAHPEEVHLTVAVVRYDKGERKRKGVASTFLAERLINHQTVGVYVQPAKHFRLPEDDNAPVVMVGPGTGVAPFRAFVEERRAREASGGNWLFFGNPHGASDFLYHDEWRAYQEEGLLTRLDTAFSRDQEDKVYVHHRMREQAAELWSWLEASAYLYVCGDAERMAPDVDRALHDIVAEQGGLSAEQAQAYVKKMAKEGRYLRDVY